MTLIIEKPTGAKLELRKGWQPMDPDAAAYISAVETADGQALEEKTKIAIDNFVLGCKADGIWSAIKASCILAGARTLTGALVPLVGTAPTNNNFVSGDYNRKTGLVGDGSTKYLNSNRNNNADPQNNHHIALRLTQHPTINFGAAGIGLGDTGATAMLISSNLMQSRSRSSSSSANVSFIVGTAGISRGSSSSYVEIRGSTTNTVAMTSQTPLAGNIFVFARNNAGSINQPVDARLAFYSIGESLNLALLDSRVTDLINAIGAAIP
jgi:hypothetical protein